jgi:hypothetical protein
MLRTARQGDGRADGARSVGVDLGGAAARVWERVECVEERNTPFMRDELDRQPTRPILDPPAARVVIHSIILDQQRYAPPAHTRANLGAYRRAQSGVGGSAVQYFGHRTNRHRFGRILHRLD